MPTPDENTPVPQSIGLAELGILRELLAQVVLELRSINAKVHDIREALKKP